MADIENQREDMLEWHVQDLRDELLRLRGERLPIQVQITQRGGRMPTRAHPGDAGFDLYISEDCWIDPGEFVDVHCDVQVALPPSMWGLIIGRSSTLRKRGLLVNQGVIDSGYRGELYAGCWNLGSSPVQVEQGERVAQFIPFALTAATVTLLRTEQLPMGDRGDQGFGSTGA